MKRYDARYFERWYRHSRIGFGAREFVARKARLAVAAAEYLLGRPIRSALDVGCGEARWRAHLLALRPRLAYTGVDDSAYVIRRYGRTRNIVRGSVGGLANLALPGPYDLVVCADVLHYVPTPEARRGLAAMHALTGGAAWLEAFTATDDIEGDMAGFQRRAPAAYRRLFREAGFVPLGLHLHAASAMAPLLVALERPANGR